VHDKIISSLNLESSSDNHQYVGPKYNCTIHDYPFWYIIIFASLRSTQLTQWCSGNASALGARGPGFNPVSGKGFLFCCCFNFFVIKTTHYLSQKFAILFTILIY